MATVLTPAVPVNEPEVKWLLQVVRHDEPENPRAVSRSGINHLRVVAPDGRTFMVAPGQWPDDAHTIYQTRKAEEMPEQEITFYARQIVAVNSNLLRMNEPECITLRASQFVNANLDEAFAGTLY